MKRCAESEGLVGDGQLLPDELSPVSVPGCERIEVQLRLATCGRNGLDGCS